MSSGPWQTTQRARPGGQHKYTARKRHDSRDSVVPEDDENKVRKAFEAQDAAFRGAMLGAIEAGLERMPAKPTIRPEGLPTRFEPPGGSCCSSATSWDTLRNRPNWSQMEHENGLHSQSSSQRSRPRRR